MRKRFTQLVALLTATSLLIPSAGTISVIADDTFSEEYVTEAFEEEQFATEKQEEETGDESEGIAVQDDYYFAEEPSEEIAEPLEEIEETSEETSEETDMSSEENFFEESSESQEEIYFEENSVDDDVAFSITDRADEEEITGSDDLFFSEDETITEELNDSVSTFDESSYDYDEYARSGKCGDNATWRFEGTGENLTLIISGSGKMYDYDTNPDEKMAPWV